MSSSPSSSAQAAREAVAVRLRELMVEAGLKGHELAARCGWNAAKTSRIVNARTQPSDADIRAWCAACAADDQADDLVASARAVESMYVEWRRLQRNGLRRVQEDFHVLHRRSALCRVYVSNVVPGFFQTAPYATAVLGAVSRFWDTPDDVAEAVASRVARGRLLYEGRHRFAVVMEEWVLRSRIGDAETMAGQLRHLLAVLPLASVSLGVIPAEAPRALWPMEAFYLYDDRRAVVETLTAEVNVTQPREIADYARAFAGLSRMAVYGEGARARITEALEALG
ncbi:helix-turn-helix transcriptional regulator [Streptomyces sp. NPDC048659]|uniref:helix-turn-helix domain-containing protein n=1 Tax=Streptomyces sp. NPDC048659 TaxID=3155489 RepID=UPI00342A2B0A